ncbi:MAG TPA: N-acyl homoserine lactonase family protein [Chloroflexota bacterium]|nr:N-acyl homoserine lactonase family protein [Chloroflexota bacterium]
MRLFVLSAGALDADRSVIHPGDDSHRRVTLPVPILLIQTEGQNILVDTGLPIDVPGDPDALKTVHEIDPAWIRSDATAEQRVDRQLGFLGLLPADIDLVVNTHFHFDHAGGNALFPGVPIAAQEAELIAARESDGYLPVWDAPGLQFRTVRGDWSPVEGVEFLFTPGHSAGHQSLLIRTGDQPWLFTVDAVYTEEHWRRGLLGAVSDIAAARESLARLHAIVESEGARVVFGHDAAQWDSLLKGQSGRPVLLVET